MALPRDALRGGLCEILNCVVGDDPHTYFPERCKSGEAAMRGSLCQIERCANGEVQMAFNNASRLVQVPHLNREGCRPLASPTMPAPVAQVGGMGPDAPVLEGENGAKQSAIPIVFTTMPLRALWELAKLQKYGDDKYGPHNWRGIPEDQHLDHAFAHLLSYQLGDLTDDHLLHAAWRLVAALELRLTLPQEPGEGKPF